MKLIIFAGGTGTRLWPLSRQALPKQFMAMFDGKSTLQLAIERVAPAFGLDNIIVSTNEKYRNFVMEQLPDFPADNIIGEPERRELGPAVGFNLIQLKKRGYSGPVGILWADHLMGNVPHFIDSLKLAEQINIQNPQKIVFISEKPRFPNNNLGWIHVGAKNTDGSHQFLEWRYKPEYGLCEEMFASGEWDWNPGYLVEDLDHALNLFKQYAPEIHERLEEVYDALGADDAADRIAKIYATMPKVTHDDAIAKRIKPEDAVVIRSDMSWADPGTLYALKEALTKREADNLEMGTGRVTTLDTTDSLVVNEEPDKLVATIGLNGMVVVNTPDVLLVVPKSEILKISGLVNQLADDPETVPFT